MASKKRQTVNLLRALLLLGCATGWPGARPAVAADIWQALRQAQNDYQLAPDAGDTQRRYILALRDARLPAAALSASRQHPNAISAEELRGLEADEVAEWVRLASAPTRTQEERYALADRALQRYDDLIRQWHAQGLNGTDVYQRIRVDRIQALHARQRMHDVVSSYNELRQENIKVPDYILNEVAAAWLYLKQPEKAAALYKVALDPSRLDDQELNDDRLALYYALRESGQHDAASEQLAGWVTQQPARRPIKGSPQPLPSEAWLNLTRTAAIDPLYDNRPDLAINTLQALVDAAPRDVGLQLALGDVQRIEGQHRRAEMTLKQAETLDPHNAELINTQGMNALALQEWAQARELTAWATAHYPDSQSTQRLNEALEAHDKPELQLTTRATRATDSPVAGSRDLATEAVLYSSPIKENWRLFGAAGYATADFEEGKMNHRWIRAGAQWRSRDMTLEADVSGQNYGHGTRTGARVAATFDLNDDWQVGATLAWRPPDAPLRALKNNITTRRADVWVKYGSSTDSQLMLAVAPTRFSDGNQRIEARLHGRQRLYAAADLKVHLELDISASRNSKDNTPYFNPRRDLEILPGLVLTHTLYQRYDTVLEHGIEVRAGTYSQQGYGTGSVAALGYSMRYQTGRHTDIRAGIMGIRRPYDGRQEREMRFQLDLNFRF